MDFEKKSARKMASNTAILYVKMIITAIFALLTMKLLIESLGVEEYGIFNLIAGVVAMLGFLNSAMTVATQRYLSFNLGKKNICVQKQIFCNSFYLHISIGIFVSAILFILSDSILERLNIGGEYRFQAASLYYFMIGTVFFSILIVPFRAILISRENIVIDAIFLLIQSILKLALAIYISLSVGVEKISTLGYYLLIINVVSLFFYAYYCLAKYKECVLFVNHINFRLLKEMISFALWSLYTNVCYILNTQGLNVLFNIYYGTAINAAYGVAFQVNTQAKELSQSLLKAVSPQIMQSEGKENRHRMINLSIMTNKLGFMLVGIIFIPLSLSIDYIISLWLKVVPEYAAEFALILLLSTLINQITVGLTPAVQAIGNIRRFQFSIGTIALFLLPASYLMLQQGLSPDTVMLAVIFIEVTTGFVKLSLFSAICGYKKSDYIKHCILRLLIPFLITIGLSYSIFGETGNLLDLIVLSFISIPFYILMFLIISLEPFERAYLKNIINIPAIVKKMRWKNQINL